MVLFDHVQVWLVAGEKRCDEFVNDEEPDETQENNTYTRYCEVGSNMHWRIEVRIDKQFDWQSSDAVVARVIVDGKPASRSRMLKPKGNIVRPLETTVNGYLVGYGSQTKSIRFRFADLETRDMTDQDDKSQFQKLYGELGTIKVLIEREIVLGTKQKRSRDDLEDPLYDIAPARPREYSLKTKTRKINTVGEVRLKYRTRCALQTLMVIERSPSPVPLSERRVEDLTRDELVQLERQRRIDEELRKKIKRERTSVSPIVRPLKTTKGEHGRVIYHLDSDDDEEDQSVKPKVLPNAAASEANPREEDVEVVTLL